DGTALSDVLQANDIEGEGWADVYGWWSADGRAWIYWLSSRKPVPDLRQYVAFSDLVAFYVDERRFEILASDVRGELSPKPIANGKIVVKVGPGLEHPGNPPKLVVIQNDGSNRVTLQDNANGMYYADLRIGGAANAIIIRWDTGIRQHGRYHTGHRVVFVWA